MIALYSVKYCKKILERVLKTKNDVITITEKLFCSNRHCIYVILNDNKSRERCCIL